MLFLTVGLVMTGHAILTPLLMVILMTTGDFLAMSATTDNVRPSEKPNSWRLAAVTSVFSGQSVFYVMRDRQHLWSSRPSRWVALSSAADVLIIGNLAAFGILMTALPVELVGGILAAAVVFAFVLDTVKVAVFARLKMT